MVRVGPLLALAAAVAATSGGCAPMVPQVDCSRDVSSVSLALDADTIEVSRALRIHASQILGRQVSGSCYFIGSWRSSDPAAASVSSSTNTEVVVIGMAPDTMTITYSVGTATGSASLTVVPLHTPFTAVSAGDPEVCALASDGRAYCWAPVDDPGPVLVPGGIRFTALDAGSQRYCGLTSGVSALCWGSGALGDGSYGSTVPVKVALQTAVSAVDAGGDGHTCALTTGGIAYCWGQNALGQLGNPGDSSPSRGFATLPRAVSGGLTLQALAAGANHTCGLASGGFVWCWGDDSRGQVGSDSVSGVCAISPLACQMRPIRVTTTRTFVALTAGGRHSCALTAGGDAYCWGWNAYGQLGTGDTLSGFAPRLVAGGMTFTAITAGTLHTCALSSAGVAYCWGSNADGQLGATQLNGVCPYLSNPCATSPAKVLGGLAFTAINAGTSGTCAMATDGAWCWGANTGSGVPVRLPGQP